MMELGEARRRKIHSVELFLTVVGYLAPELLQLALALGVPALEFQDFCLHLGTLLLVLSSLALKVSHVVE